ncbi:DUF6177 family protein [Nocardiopsis salina]|uniref:DUF6177 family protein n=1 Tax=Nocardiopsis salina TaxID=245836 RepID=UPI00373AF2EC
MAEAASELVAAGSLEVMEVRRGRGPAELTRRPFLTGATVPAAFALGAWGWHGRAGPRRSTAWCAVCPGPVALARRLVRPGGSGNRRRGPLVPLLVQHLRRDRIARV